MFDKKLKVNEIFGPTIQGEGPATGRHCLFVRLYGCNLTCSFCDTPQTWVDSADKALLHEGQKVYDKNSEHEMMEASDVVFHLKALWPLDTKPTTIVISGGEPLMQQKQVEPLIASLALLGCEVHFETAGTIKPSEMLTRYTSLFVVSPKLESSSNRLRKRFKPEVLKAFADTGKAWFKFVVTDEDDLEEVDVIVKECKLGCDRVMIMPEGTKSEEVLEGGRKLVDLVTRRGYGLSLRNHILLWEDKRGV